ncbi:hypothetical protein F5883DRAFT_369561, partial [Diaporthe sp. PMI_573]
PNRQISIRRRRKETSEEEFCTSVEMNLRALPRPNLDSTEGINVGLWEIVRILEDAIKEHVPSHNPCEANKPHVSPNAKEQMTYKEFVSSSTVGDPQNTQRWAKRARQRAQPTQNPFTPDFNFKGGKAKTAQEKTDMYIDAIYGQGNTSRERSVHPELPMCLGHELERMVPGDKKNQGEVLKSINSLPDRKATGIDIIGNEALKMVGDIVAPYLEDIFGACLSKGHYPEWLKFSRT